MKIRKIYTQYIIPSYTMYAHNTWILFNIVIRTRRRTFNVIRHSTVRNK